ncbi:MAG: hypothetical protein F6K36_13295 [Symploca sp. SIO3C6]|nr:hypothetical protein [Symploca sp. SIO3C6]
MNNQQEQLFTELTPEEGAVIEGGATLFLYGVYAVRAGADKGGFLPGDSGDDLYVKVNEKTVFGPKKDVDTGEFVRINKKVSFTGSAKVSLFDEDPGIDPDDFLGGFKAGSTPSNVFTKVRVKGSGSIYDVIYRVTA